MIDRHDAALAFRSIEKRVPGVHEARFAVRAADQRSALPIVENHRFAGIPERSVLGLAWDLLSPLNVPSRHRKLGE